MIIAQESMNDIDDVNIKFLCITTEVVPRPVKVYEELECYTNKSLMSPTDFAAHLMRTVFKEYPAKFFRSDIAKDIAIRGSFWINGCNDNELFENIFIDPILISFIQKQNLSNHDIGFLGPTHRTKMEHCLSKILDVNVESGLDLLWQKYLNGETIELIEYKSRPTQDLTYDANKEFEKERRQTDLEFRTWELQRKRMERRFYMGSSDEI
jgi:hypothetical protein